MTIYLDNDYRCHLTDDGTMQAVETDLFDGKCQTYIEGYRLVPDGQTWTRPDGTVFHGQMIAPAENYSRLKKAQEQYERDEADRLRDLGIPRETDFKASRNYPAGSFIGCQGSLYEAIRSIPAHSSIVPGSNAILTTVEHYIESLEEDRT